MKKRILFLLLCVPLFAHAYDAEIDGIYYDFSGEKATVTYRNTSYNSYSGKVTIPSSVTYNGKTYSVTSIGHYAFKYCSGLTSVTIPNSVTSIGDNAFNFCMSLTSITIPKSVTSIGYYAFQNCSKLTSVTIPNSVTSIGNYAFYNCSKLTSVTIPNSVTSIGNYAFSGCSGLTSVTIPNSVKSIRSEAFKDCSKIASVTISCKDEGDFSNYVQRTDINKVFISPFSYVRRTISIGGEERTSVSIPNSVTSIGEDAFSGCSSLTSVTIPNSVTSIGSYAFKDCSGLKTVINMSNLNIKKGSTGYGYVGYYATNVINSNQIFVDGDFVYSDSEKIDLVIYVGIAVSVEIPSSVKEIYDNCFNGNTKLTSLRIGSNVQKIGTNAFTGCKNLMKVFITANTKPVGIETAFDNVNGRQTYVSNNNYDGISTLGTINKSSSLSSMFEANGVKYIPISMSARTCEAVDATYSAEDTEVSIDQTVAYRNVVFKVLDVKPHVLRNNPYVKSLDMNFANAVPEYAFAGCNQLEIVTIGGNITELSKGCFDGNNNLQTLNISDGDAVLPLPTDVFRSGKLAQLHLGRNLSYTAGNGATTYSPFSSITTLQQVEIGEKVEEIKPSMFRDCSTLETAALNSRLSAIGDYAFAGCGVLNKFTNTSQYTLRITPSVARIGAHAFDDVKDIQTITIEASSTPIEIGSGVFSKSGVHKLYVGRDIKCDASPQPFADCTDLEELEFAKDVTTINEYAYTNTGIKVLTLPEKTTVLSAGTFYKCGNLTSVAIPKNVTTIGDKCFGETGLLSVEIGNNVKTIGKSAFENSKQMTYASVAAESIGESAFVGTGLVTAEITTQVESIGTSAFSMATKLQTVHIGAASIGEDAFYGCSRLQEAVLNERCKSIGSGAFKGCTALQTVNVPSGVTTLNSRTFYDCSNLTSIVLPKSVTSVGEYVFANSGIQSFEAENTIEQIGLGTFNGCKALKKFVAKSGSKTLELSYNASNRGLFADCPLETVNIDRPINYDTQAVKGYSPFYRNTTLKSVTMGDNPASVPANMFYGCSALSDVAIGNGVTSIGDYAFSGCTSLKDFSFGRSVKTIGNEAFSDCTALTRLVSKAGVPPTCGSQALEDIVKWDCTLYVPEESKEAYMAANQWMDFFFVENFVDRIEGDIDGDGELTMSDAYHIMNAFLGKESLDIVIADINGDGKVTMADANALMNMYLENHNPGHESVSELSLNKTSLSFTLNDGTATKQLTVSVKPNNATNKEVEWTTSNSNVATVSNTGLVTAVGAGECVITCTAKDGSGVKAECNVKVEEGTNEKVTKNIYSWTSPNGAVQQTGGTITYVKGIDERINYKVDGTDYYTICLCGKRANMGDYESSQNASYMEINFDEPLKAGDVISFTAFYNKSEYKNTSAYIVFENGTSMTTSILSNSANIALGGSPEVITVTVPEGADGVKSLKMTRDATQTNFYITKLEITGKRID